MDLPLFQDNLRSSSGWLAELERERPAWNASLYSNLRERISEADRPAYDLVPEWTVISPVGISLIHLVLVNSALTGQHPAMSRREDTLRNTEAAPFVEGHDPVPAVILQRILDNALDWFRTDSFNELHPVEQAALVLLRLFDLQPFPSHNLETAIISASFYTMRANLPPLVMHDDSEMKARFDAALRAAFRMLTQPLVEAIAENLTGTIRMITR